MTLPTPEFPFSILKRYDVIVDKFTTGSVFRRQVRGKKSRRGYRLTYKNIRVTDINDIQTEFNLARGANQVFTFTPPDVASAVSVRFIKDSITFNMITSQQYSTVFELIEELF